LNQVKKLGVYKVEKDSIHDIELPHGELITSFTMKSSHEKCMIALILNGNRVVFDVPTWLFKRAWLPLGVIDTGRYNSTVLRLRNYSKEETAKVEIYYVRSLF